MVDEQPDICVELSYDTSGLKRLAEAICSETARILLEEEMPSDCSSTAFNTTSFCQFQIFDL